MNEVLWCGVCEDYFAESKIDVLEHLSECHTLKERTDALIESGHRPEVSADE